MLREKSSATKNYWAPRYPKLKNDLEDEEVYNAFLRRVRIPNKLNARQRNNILDRLSS